MEKIWSPNIPFTILKSPGRLRKLSVFWRRLCLMGLFVLGVVSQTKQVPSLKLTYPLKIGLPNRKFHLLTIHFQGRTVSFREGIKAKYSHFYGLGSTLCSDITRFRSTRWVVHPRCRYGWFGHVFLPIISLICITPPSKNYVFARKFPQNTGVIYYGLWKDQATTNLVFSDS